MPGLLLAENPSQPGADFEAPAERSVPHRPESMTSSEDSAGAESADTKTADTKTADTEDEAARQIIHERVTVVGDAERAERLPGSAHVVTLEEIERYRYDDVQRMLRQVPGVNIQEEDGYGLRPNIGLRGSGVERSQKITLLEDGVLVAPAPYAAPAAYYSPTAGRMESLEVRKGSSSIRQGPQTIGGVLNYVSTSIPDDRQIRLELAGGSDDSYRLHASAGASNDRFGYLVETYQRSTDGFKKLDGGGDTGFELNDYLAKLRFNSASEARFFQQLELKLGHTEQDGNETYLGLTEADFASDPFRRYRGSQLDHIDADHDGVSLRHFIKASDRLNVTTTVYRNEFFRDWFKNESTLGVSNARVLADPATYADQIAILRGEVDSVDDAFALRHNRRDYASQGIQSVIGWNWLGKSSMHDLEIGVRYHEDEEDRFQEDDRYAMRDGSLVLTTRGVAGSQSNRLGKARALALFVQDQISFGNLTVTPGVRFEQVETNRFDYGRDDPARSGADLALRSNSFDAIMPGLGVSWSKARWTVFGGVHKGFSPPGPSSREPVEPEESINYELGARFSEGSRRFELTGFWNDYSNLLGADTLSGGGSGSGDQFNGGEVELFGLEFGVADELWAGDGWKIPARLTYTFTRGEFGTSFETSFADWAPEVVAGDRLPYLPEHQLFAEVGLELTRWSAFVSANYVDEMRTSAGTGDQGERIEDHVVLDLAVRLQVPRRKLDSWTIFATVNNITDQAYVVARRPYGLRPGLPRSVSGGLSVQF